MGLFPKRLGEGMPASASIIFYSARSCGHISTAAGVDREVRGYEKASDHAPVWIDLSMPPARRRRR